MSFNLTKSDNKMAKNLTKLDKITTLSKNWNEYNAEPFSKSLITHAKNLIRKLYIQPEIFPTAIGSLQIEYEKDNGDYLEIQVTEEFNCEVYMIKDKKEYCFNVINTPTEINKLVNNFHGLSL